MGLPVTRMLAVLELLQGHPRISGPELARRLDIDVRTLRRYIVALEQLGIPITTERGRHGAYMLVSGFKLPPLMFTNDEALALAVGLVAARSLGLAEGTPAAASAEAKLARAMPQALSGKLGAIAETVKIDLAQVTATPASNQALIALTAAAQARQRIRMGYRTPQGQDTEREVDIYGLACRAGAWYAVGWCHLRRDLRSFRLDRIGAVGLLAARFERPRHFDPLLHLATGIATLPRKYAIEVWLHADLGRARQAFPLAFGLIEPAADGVILRSTADDLAWFARQLAALPFAFEVRSPARLRGALRKLAARLMAQAPG